MNSEWIKFSERKPALGDYPIWVESPDWKEPESPRYVYDDFLFGICGFSPPPRSWMPAKLPAPPKEKTQKELDTEACRAQETHPSWTDSFAANLFEVGWHAALAWERKEVGAILKLSVNDWPPSSNAKVVIPASDYAKLCNRIGL